MEWCDVELRADVCHQDLELRPGPPCCTILDSSWPTLKVTPHTGTKQKCATITSKLWGRGGIHRQLLTTYLKPITGLGAPMLWFWLFACAAAAADGYETVQKTWEELSVVQSVALLCRPRLMFPFVRSLRSRSESRKMLRSTQQFSTPCRNAEC